MFISADIGLGDPFEYPSSDLNLMENLPITGLSGVGKDSLPEVNTRAEFPLYLTDAEQTRRDREVSIYPFFAEPFVVSSSTLESDLQSLLNSTTAARRRESQDYGLSRDDGVPFKAQHTFYIPGGGTFTLNHEKEMNKIPIPPKRHYAYLMLTEQWDTDRGGVTMFPGWELVMPEGFISAARISQF